MNKEEQKSKFAQKIEAFASELNTEIEGQKKGFIVIGIEEEPIEGEEGKTSKNAVIGVTGNGGLLADGLAQFITNPKTGAIHNQALKMAMLKRTLEKLLG